MKKLISIIVVFFLVFTLTGCDKLKTVSIKNEKTKSTIELSYKEKANYTLSYEKDDFRTSLEKAILLGDNFRIGFEFGTYSSGDDFSKREERYKSYDEYKSVTYNNIKGYQFYYPSYVRYEVVLPVNDKEYVKLNIYGKDNKVKKDETTEVYNSKTVQDILNTIKITSK